MASSSSSPLSCPRCQRPLHWKGNSFWDCRKCRQVLLYHQSTTVESCIDELHKAFQRYPVLHVIADAQVAADALAIEPDTQVVWWATDDHRVQSVRLVFFDDSRTVVLPLTPHGHWEWIHNEQDPNRDHLYYYVDGDQNPGPDPDLDDENIPVPSSDEKKRKTPPDHPGDHLADRPRSALAASSDQWLIHDVDPLRASSLIQWATRLVSTLKSD